VLLLDDDVIAAAPTEPGISLPDAEAASIILDLSLQVLNHFCFLCGVQCDRCFCSRLRTPCRSWCLLCLWGNHQVALACVCSASLPLALIYASGMLVQEELWQQLQVGAK
jgi:hypothetical protein